MSFKFTVEQCQTLADIALNSQSERGLIKAFQKEFPGVWESAACWATLGGSEDCAAATSGQQKTPEAAAKEPVANSFDAILQDRLEKLPAGVATPQTNQEAWALLRAHGLLPSLGDVVVFRQADGKKSDVELGEEHSGGSPDVSFGVMDRGCGQPPERMVDTFLAVLKGSDNKRDKNYLMGRYCAGSTGVHNFAGVHGIRLVMTRTSDKGCPWSIALIRYRPHSRGVLEYFAPGGVIPTMPGEPIVPLRDKAGDAWEGSKSHPEMGKLASGSFVKVYSFDMPKLGNSSFAALGAMVDQRFGSMPFDVACFDSTRGGHYTVKPGSSDEDGADLRVANGVCGWARAESAKLAGVNAVELEVPGEDGSWEGKTVRVRVWRLPEVAGLSKRLGTPRGFHLLSQQVHCVESKAWLSDLDMGALSDEIVVEIDASELPSGVVARIFSSDRENINDNPIGRAYRARVGTAIKSDPDLLQWAVEARERRKKAALESAAGDYSDKFDRWSRVANAAAAKAAKQKLEAMRAEARLAIGGDAKASGAASGAAAKKSGAAKALPAPAGSREAKRALASKGGAKTKGSREAGAASRVEGLSKKAKKLAHAKIAKARLTKDGVDKELAPELFTIQAAKADGDDAVFTFHARAPETFEEVAGGKVVFDLELVDARGKAILVDGVETVWASAAELDEVEDLELAGRGRRGAAQLMMVTIGTKDGRVHDGKPTKKISQSHQYAMFEAKALESMIELCVNIDHQRLIEEAADGNLQEFQDEVVSIVYSFIVGSMGAKARVCELSPIFKDGKKLSSTEAQLAGLIPALDSMAVAVEAMASVNLLRQAEKDGAKAGRRKR